MLKLVGGEVAVAMTPLIGLEIRKAYLEANRARCHALVRPANTSGLYMNWEETDPTHRRINKSPLAAARGSGGLNYDIVAGHPEKSIIVFRMNSVDPRAVMPELGRNLIDLGLHYRFGELIAYDHTRF